VRIKLIRAQSQIENSGADSWSGC